MNSFIDAGARAPLVRFPTGALLALHRTLAQDRSPQESATLVRELGYESGESFYHALVQWLDDRGAAAPESLAADDFWPLLSEFFSGLGWGPLRLQVLHEAVVALESEAWAEADALAGAQLPMCHLTTGILADLLGRIAGTDLAVMEVECRSAGDPRCRFLLGSPDALGMLHERLRGGSSLEHALVDLG